jgi:hypothetical protein
MWQLKTMNQVFTIQTTCIFDEKGKTAICHSSEDGLLHHREVETEYNS